ncbi:TPA: hypothetical protein HNO27_24600 [Escherichia coli]|nr:hypothetical protein [Escherichia coli]HAJ7257753.1 hypothetical protein [Escherichia coli]HAJ7262583.1 hypothetical protein [Escherichia coli]HBA2641103.1 hypothetical protein [Escherichia coli]
MLPISNAKTGYGIASRFGSSLVNWSEAEMCKQMQSLLSSNTQSLEIMPLEQEIQKRACQTLIYLLKDREWTLGVQKSGIYNVKFCFQNTEHLLSIVYDSGCNLLTIRVDEHQSTEKLSIFNFASNLAGLLDISVNEVYFKLVGIDSKDVIDLFKIEYNNQEGLVIFGKSVPRTCFNIKASTEALWTAYEDRFSKFFPDIYIQLPHSIGGASVSSQFKNVAVTYLLERYLKARHTNHVIHEEILDLGRIFSPTIVNRFGYFDVPLRYFNNVLLSWPWSGKDCWPYTNGICKDFDGWITSAEMMVYDDLNPFDGGAYIMTCKKILSNRMTGPEEFSRWLKEARPS